MITGFYIVIDLTTELLQDNMLKFDAKKSVIFQNFSV